ncbi:hypothetical protein LTS08_003054 [Lithohypha guttulata]|nr:hypothetical protein LTS08_003054 [Lithohypha guttulata]
MASPMPEAKPSGATSIAKSSAYVGGGAGALGAAFAAAHATLKGRNAALWGAAAGFQCFVLGSTFWFSRDVLRNNVDQGQGSLAGMAGGAMRSRGNIIPGAIVFGLVGLGGQAGLSALAGRIDAPDRERRPILDRLSDSKWWPLKSVSDEDYERELTEKIVGLEAELEVIDEKIALLRRESTGITDKT